MVPKPLASLSLTSPGADPTALALSWSQTTDLSFGNYTVEESTNGSSGPWTIIASITSATTTTYVVNALSPGGTYFWQVIDHGFLSTTPSNVVVAVQPPVASLNYTALTSTSVQLNWSNSASYGGPIAFGSYVVEEVVGSGSPAPIATLTNSATMTYTIQSLSSGTAYSFYILTMDCTGGCGGASPTLTTTQSNVVTYGPPLPLGVTVATDHAVLDTAQLAVFTCTPSGGASPFAFSWDFGNGTLVLGTSSEGVSYASAGLETVTCRVTDAQGTRASGATTVTVHARPLLNLTTNRTRADLGQSVSFTGSVTFGTPPVNLAWSFGDNASLSGANVTHTYRAWGHYVAVCTGVDATGTQVSSSITMTISPALNETLNASTRAAAPGIALSFQSYPQNGSGSYLTTSWQFGDGHTAVGPNVSHAYATPGSFVVNVTVEDSNGASRSASVTVGISAIQVQVVSEPTTLRTGVATTFSASATGGAGSPYTFTWTFGDGTTLVGASVSHAYGAAGTYAPHLSVRDRLGAIATTPLATVTVTGPPPSPLAPWVWELVAALLVGVVALALLWVVWRRRSARALEGPQRGRVPPTDPNEVTRGARVCRNCGASNLPIRETCINCGRPLRRAPFS
jgi:PKD repeat protein